MIRTVFYYALIITSIIAFSVFLKNNCIAINLVSGPSMAPTINDGGIILSLERPLMDFLKIKFNYGDIVLLNAPNSTILVKRIAAFAEDKIWVEEFQVLVNGERKDSKTEYLIKERIDCKYTEIFDVPRNHVFLIGDNLCESHDSRSFGPVNMNHLRSKVLWVVYRG